MAKDESPECLCLACHDLRRTSYRWTTNLTWFLIVSILIGILLLLIPAVIEHAVPWYEEQHPSNLQSARHWDPDQTYCTDAESSCVD